MPYVLQSKREELDTGRAPEDVGEMNYVIYKRLLFEWKESPRYATLHDLTLRFGTKARENEFLTDIAGRIYMESQFSKGKKFDDIWDHVLTASCRAVGELDRRYGNAYEDKKIKENGDVLN